VPDAQLRGVFYQHRNDFNQLLSMSKEDPLMTRVAFDFTMMDTDAGPKKNVGLSDSRWQEYRSLFRKLGLTDGFVRTTVVPSAVLFYARCEGSAIDADCKGFAYSEKPLSPLAESLDRPKDGWVFETLAPNWYLFRWVN
jgi:hypothetical protein